MNAFGVSDMTSARREPRKLGVERRGIGFSTTCNSIRCLGRVERLPWRASRPDRTSTYCQCDAMSVSKDERLQIRVDPAEKRLLERAAEASHVSVSAFVLQSAASRVAEVLAERQLIELGPEAAGAFNEALDAPGMVNQRLASALERPRKSRWID